MAEETATATGGCMCGAVRYEAVGAPRDVGHCHCRSCRQHTGAPVVTLVVFKGGQVAFTKGSPRVYESSPGVERGFCERCGTSLSWERGTADDSIIDVHISTLDDPGAFVPSVHWHHSERIDWFEVADSLPRLHGDSPDEEPYHHGPVIDGPSG